MGNKGIGVSGHRISVNWVVPKLVCTQQPELGDLGGDAIAEAIDLPGMDDRSNEPLRN
jgi:hypothetical protein